MGLKFTGKIGNVAVFVNCQIIYENLPLAKYISCVSTSDILDVYLFVLNVTQINRKDIIINERFESKGKQMNLMKCS